MLFVQIPQASEPNTDFKIFRNWSIDLTWKLGFKFFIVYSKVLSALLNGFLNCSCNHLTSFGGSFFVKPNPIDFDQVLVEFKRLADTGNVAVIVTVAVVFLCYIFVIVFVRKADQQDTRNVST